MTSNNAVDVRMETFWLTRVDSIERDSSDFEIVWKNSGRCYHNQIRHKQVHFACTEDVCHVEENWRCQDDDNQPSFNQRNILT